MPDDTTLAQKGQVLPPVVQLSPEEQGQYQQAAAQQPAPGVVQLSPEEQASYRQQSGIIDPMQDFTSEQLKVLHFKDPNFKLQEQLASRPELAKDPALVQKAADAYSLVRQAPITEKLPSVGTMIKNAGVGLWDLAKYVKTAAMYPGTRMLSALQDLSHVFSPLQTEQEKKVAADTQAIANRPLVEAAAGTQLGLQQLAEMADHAEQFAFGKSPKKFTPEEKVNDFLDAVEKSKLHREMASGKGGVLSDKTLQELKDAGAEVRPEKVAEYAGGDPLSWFLMGKGFHAAGKAASVVAKPVAAVAEKIPGAALVSALPSKAAEEIAGRTLQATGKAVESASKLGEHVGGSSGALLGGLMKGDVSHALMGALAGQFNKHILSPAARKVGGTIKEVGKQVATGEITSPWAQAAFDAAQSAPGAAADVLKGVGFDVGTAAVTAQTPEEAEGVGMGTAFGALGGAKRMGGHMLSGQLIAPRAGNKLVSPEAIKAFLGKVAPGTDYQGFSKPAEAEAWLRAKGLSEKDASDYAKQDGAYIPSLNAVITTSPQAAAHEAFHAMEQSIGPEKMTEVRKDIQDRHTPEQWYQISQHYARALNDGNAVAQGTVEDFLASRSGYGHKAAMQKLGGEIPEGKTWKDILTPAEIKAQADKYIASEIGAENFAAWFNHAGPSLAEGQSLPERTARAAAPIVSALGGEPLAGRKSPAPALEFPLKHDVMETVKSATQPLVEPKETTKPAEKPVIEPAPIPTQSSDAITGKLSEAKTRGLGVLLSYLGAKGESRQGVSSDTPFANREVRRATVDLERDAPAEARTPWDKHVFPVKSSVIASTGELQHEVFVPAILKANAQRFAKSAVENPALGKALAEQTGLQVDPQTGSLTPESWKLLDDNLQKVAGNHEAGRTGSGVPLQLTPELEQRGFFKPGLKASAGEVPQGLADFINILYGNSRVPKTARIQKNYPLNIAGQEVSKATIPGRVAPVTGVEPRFSGDKAEKFGVEDRPVLEVNPLRAALERAAGGKENLPSVLDAYQKLNLSRITGAELASEATPKVTGNTLAIAAGFQPSKKAGQSKLEQEKSGPVWFSHLEKTLKDKMPPRTSGEQLLNTLRNSGVKQDELKWSGVEDFLKARQEVTKPEIEKFLADNPFKVNEIVKGGAKKTDINFDSKYAIPSVIRLADEHHGEAPEALLLTLENDGNIYRQLTAKFPELKNDEDWGRTVAEDVFGTTENLGETKFQNYQLPGGENYQEHLFQLPEKAVKQAELFTMFDRETDEEIGEYSSRQAAEKALQKASVAFPNRRFALRADPTGTTTEPNFTSSHWDEPNVLAHARSNERTDTAGRPGLFLEELQSDWHQKGRKEGYQLSDPERLEYERLKRLLDEKGNEIPPEEFARYKELRAQEGFLGPPDAPFKNTWHEMAFRRMVREAVERGKKWIGWTTGEQQAERYNLSKQVSKIRVIPVLEGSPSWVEGKRYSVIAMNGNDEVLHKFVNSENEMAELIGKDLALKAVERTSASKTSEDFSGPDLKVGGEGMKGFYDKILVDYANKFGKRFGAKVHDIGVPTADVDTAFHAAFPEAKTRDTRTVHALDIAPEMAKQLRSEGVAQFSPKESGDKPEQDDIHSAQLAQFVPRQLVTPEWEKKLKASKVRFEDGTLKPVFHATVADFPISEMDTTGFRAHFGSPGQAAEKVMGSDELARTDKALTSSEGARVFPVFLDIKNPLRTDDAGMWEMPDSISDVLRDAGIKLPTRLQGPTINNQIDVEVQRSLEKGVDEETAHKSRYAHWSNEIKRFLQARGYDGIIYQNRFEDSQPKLGHAGIEGYGDYPGKGKPFEFEGQEEYGGDSYIPFSSDQIHPVAQAQFAPKKVKTQTRRNDDVFNHERSNDFPGFWIDPDGNLRASGDHENTAREILNLGERESSESREGIEKLYAKGWRTVVIEDGANNLWIRGGKPTRAQENELVRLGIEHELHVIGDNETGNLKSFYSPPGSEAQFAPKKKTPKKDELVSGDYKLQPPNGGLFSKAWILPDGKPVQIGGQWHHEWVAENPDVVKKYGLKTTDSGEENRVDALKKGFARVNYGVNGGNLTVEARAENWPNLQESVRKLVRKNASQIDSMSVYLFDKGVKKVSDSDSARLFMFSDKEKMENLPLISRPSETVSMSAQSSSENVDAQFQPKLFPHPKFDEIVDNVREGKEGGATFSSSGEAYSFKPEDPRDVVTLKSFNFPKSELTAEKVRTLLAPYDKLLQNPHLAAGVFAFGGPTVSVDINALVSQAHRKNTLAFAKANDQVSIWDAAKSEEVKTGGEGNTRLTSLSQMSRALPGLLKGEPVNVDEIVRNPIAQFQAKKYVPQTSAGREARKKGFDFTRSDDWIYLSKNGEQVGSILFSSVQPPYGELNEMYVDPRFRKQGLGEALMREAAQDLSARGVTRIGGDFLNQVSFNLAKKVLGRFDFIGDNMKEFPESEALSRLSPHPTEDFETVGNDERVSASADVGRGAQFQPSRKTIESAWKGTPDAVIHTTIANLKKQPDYDAAKKRGKPLAAVRVVQNVLKPGKMADLQKEHPDAKLVPVIAEEAEGRNKLPLATAEALHEEYNWPVELEIYQANRPQHTGAKDVERLERTPLFQGPVKKGGKYILVDDVSTSGSTLAALRSYIHRQGGKVVGATVLGAAYRPERGSGSWLAPRAETLDKLKTVDISAFAAKVNEQYGRDLEDLSNGELNIALRQFAKDTKK